jgi:ABC-type polysaccharide/polyol phosphate export permease
MDRTSERATAGSPAKPQRGPSPGWRRPLDVFRALTMAELRSAQDLTVVGILKWMAEPLLFMLVYLILFAAVLGRPSSAYPLFLMCALVPFRFFTGSVNGSMVLLNRFSSVLTGAPTPRAVLPLVLLGTEAVNLLVSLVVFVPLVLIYDVDVWPSVLWLPVVLAILVVLTAGPTYLATVFGLYFPDLRGVAQSIIRAGFFLSTALVPIGEFPREADQLRLLVKANPLSRIFESLRVVFGIVDRTSPTPFDLVYPLLVGVFLLAVGLGLYRWREPEFPKEV